MQTEGQRKFIVLLLALSCIISIYLFINTNPVSPKKLTDGAQIDSLISMSLEEFNIESSQIRRRNIQVDSVFTRSVYNIRVAPNFSKTTLHYTLQQELWPYNVKPAAQVRFPEKDLRMHLLYNDQIYRTIIVSEDQELTLQRNQPEILPGQDSHEVD